jgi:hypothetical protein
MISVVVAVHGRPLDFQFVIGKARIHFGAKTFSIEGHFQFIPHNPRAHSPLELEYFSVEARQVSSLIVTTSPGSEANAV